MPSIWDLLPASAWPVQPFVWPFDPTQPSPGTQPASPQASVSSMPTFGGAPAPAVATSAPAFGWASASRPPASAPAYSGATNPDALLGAFPHAEIDPARTAGLAEDARRAHDFVVRTFGPASRSAGQRRELAAVPYASATSFAPMAAAADTADTPLRGGATFGIDDAGNRPASADVSVPANWTDLWDAPMGNADAAPVGAVSDAPALTVGPRDDDSFAAPPPVRLSAQQRYRRAQAGDESFAPEFVRTGPTYPEAVVDGWAEAARLMTTPALPLPKGARAEDDEGRTWSRGTADPVEWQAFVADQQARNELPVRVALAMLRGGIG